MATVAQGRVNGKNGWSCGNSYIYAFQHFRKDHRQCGLPLKLGGALIEKILVKISKELRLADAKGGEHGQPSKLKIAMDSDECGRIDVPDLDSFKINKDTRNSKVMIQNDERATAAQGKEGSNANKDTKSNVKIAQSTQRNGVKTVQKPKVIKGGFLNKKGGSVVRAKGSTKAASVSKKSTVAKMERINITEVDEDEDSEESEENAEEAVEPDIDDSQGLKKTSYEHFGGAGGMADFDELD